MREDEWVVFAAKRHWAYLLRQILPPLLLLLVFTPLLYILLTSTAPMRAIFAFFITVFLISLVLLITYQYFNWKDDLFVMTTQRIVHIERVWPFRQEFEESSLENIQDIYELRPSLASQVLSFGDLILLTAGETVEIDLLGVPNPNRLRELIFREIERHRALSVLRSRGAIRDVLERRLRLEPPPPLPESETVEKPNASLAMVALVSLKEYFFPSSWVVSEDGNTIIWRRFWFPGFLRYLQTFIPFAVSTIGGAWFLASIWAAESMHWLLGVWLVLEAGLFGASIWFLEDWRNDYFQITPNRIMLVFRKPLLLQESRRETSLGQIQNISFEVPGILANFFKYGHVMLETAGATGKFELKWVRYPQKIQGEISQRQREYKQRQEEMESRRRLQELTSWFATYDALRNPSEATAEQDAPSVETTPDS